MSSLKCSNCNLVNFANSTVCKRCQADLTAVSLEVPTEQLSVTAQKRSSDYSQIATKTKPSAVSIIKNDYGAFLGLIIPFVVWGVFVASNVFGFSLSRRGRTLSSTTGSDSAFLYIAIVGTVLGIALLAWRIYSFQQTFANGEKTLGRITSISFFKDRGRVEYFYTVNGQDYQSGNAIMKNQKTKSFHDGDEIELIVDRSNPTRAFIKALYC